MPACQNNIHLQWSFLLQDLLGAERDFRLSLQEEEDSHSIHAMYNLGLTLYYRGKMRVRAIYLSFSTFNYVVVMFLPDFMQLTVYD